MAIYLKHDQEILGFRLDDVWFFDQELLRLWVHADYPDQRVIILDPDDPGAQPETLPQFTGMLGFSDDHLHQEDPRKTRPLHHRR